MLNISMKQVGGSSISTILEKTKLIPNKVKKGLEDIADESLKTMRQTIDSNRKRDFASNKPHLSMLMDTEMVIDTPATILIGVGNLDKIESQHKDPNNPSDNGQGWALLNYGGLPGKGKNPAGTFTDGVPGNAGTSRFQYQKGAGTRMFPKKLVEGIHYIEAAIELGKAQIAKLLGRL